MGQPPAIEFVTTGDGLHIAYSCHGDGPPLVFVRGWITHLELRWEETPYRAFFEQLGERFRVVRFDARGNGLSDRQAEGIDLDGLTADVEAVMDGLGLADVTMWGSAFGGPVAISYAARHPERVSRLILDNTYATMRGRGTDEARKSFLAMLSAMRQHPDAIYASFSFMQDPEDTIPHATRVGILRRSIEVETAALLYVLAAELDVSPLLGTITAPTLVIHRRGNRMVPTMLGREVAALVPGARFVGIEGTASNPWDERPADTLAAMFEFTGVGAPAGTGPNVDVVEPAADRHVFKREGEFWTIVDGATVIRLKDGRGLRWLAELLARPGVEIHAVDLVSARGDDSSSPARARPADDGVTLPSGSDLGPALDPAAKAAYRARLEELREEIEEAEAFNDAERAARARTEMDFVVEELAAAVGLGGRDRPQGSLAERSRVNVTRAIRGAIDRIATSSPDLGRHLSNSIRTGLFCSYVPDPAASRQWEL